jgi:parvulin-like peptidyl-prolyl isomerase
MMVNKKKRGEKMKKSICISLAALCICLVYTTFASEGGRSAAAAEKQVQSAQPAPDQSAAQAPGGETSSSEGEAKKVNVARVNGTDITLQSLIARSDYLSARNKHAADVSQQDDSARKEALESLIFEELAYQKAIAEGLGASKADIDGRIGELKVKLGGPEAFKERLEKNGVSEEELRAAAARDMALQRIFHKEIDDKVTVSEDEIKREFEKRKGKFIMAEKVVVNDIIFFLDPDKKESIQKAENVLKTLRDGDNKDAGSLVPDGTFIVQKTELIKEKQPEFYKKAKKLKIGELSDVIRTSDSLHVLQLKEYAPQRQFTLDDMKDYLESLVRGEARMKRMKQWEKELRSGAKIEILDTEEVKK